MPCIPAHKSNSLSINNNMNMNLVDSVLNTPRTNDKMDTGGAANGSGDAMDSEEMQVRTMEVPRWLSTPDVTSKFILCYYIYINLFSFICKY